MKSRKNFVAALFALSFLSANGADGTWVARSGVGTGGTNWTLWSDADNWDGGIVAGADGNDCSANLTAAAAQYIRMPNSLSITNFGNAGSSVFVGEGTYTFKNKAYEHNPHNCYLYFPFSFAMKTGDNYAGFGGSGDCNICGSVTSGTGTSALLLTAVNFRYDLYATEAGEERNLRVWPNEIRMNSGLRLRFVAPHGSSVALSSRWVQTADSPFLKLAAGETAHVLSVGTTVTGDGIPEGTFLKRVFPDGSIELSAAPTTSAAANTLTFAAFNAKVTASLGSRLAAYNGTGKHYICVHKYRKEDDMALVVYPNIMQHLSGGAANNKWVMTTDQGFLPGRLVMSSVWGSAAQPALVYLENCHLELPANNSYSDYTQVMVENAAHTARLTVTNNVTASFGWLTKLAGTLVKDGAGTLKLSITNDTASNVTGPIVVEEGTLEPTFVDAGTNVIASLTVKSGARFVIPEGVVLKPASLVVEEGAIFGGAGRLVYPLSSAALMGLVFEDGVSIDDGRSGGEFAIEVLRGRPSAAAQDGDSVWLFDTNALLRVNGSGAFDVLVVGGGGGGGSHNGGGGGGVVYTQRMAVASGVYSLNVGKGGKGAPDNSTYNTGGGNSGVFGLLAYGGGAGGTYDTGSGESRHYGKNGGSGGGGGIQYPYSSTVKAPGGTGVPGQGHDGGKGFNKNGTNPYEYSIGGGGGGAGSAGTDARYDETDDSVKGGNGGDGVLCNIYGSKCYGGGGGGGASYKAASGYFLGGNGGGGDGGIVTAAATAMPGKKGEDGLGGGGGGGSAHRAGDQSAPGGDGGSGIVILRWRQPSPDENSLPDSDVATGGSVRHRNGYAIHTFSDDGSFVLSEPALVDILLVGGGGGGGSRSGGGGAGGGVVVVSNAYLLSGSYDVTVGQGGAGASGAAKMGASGTDSVFSFGGAYDLCAIGGGGGGSSASGLSGGSGGGGGAPYTTWSTLTLSGGAGTAGQGFAGGTGVHSYTGSTNTDWPTAQAGGGGGAGAPGGDGDADSRTPGNGGDGILCDFSGAAVYYGGGGGGGSAAYAYANTEFYLASGGLGGGGRGGAAVTPYPSTSAGENGVDGLGGGGGGSGGACDGASTGGNGGSGVVIVRYRIRKPGMILIVE